MGLRKVTVLTEETTSYTPSNSEALYIECYGAGGGGGGASGRGISGGGGAGAFSSVTIPSGSVSLTPYTISIGPGGPGGLGGVTTRDSNTGSVGGDTWFDSASFCLAKGGSGGQGSASPKGGAGGFADDGVGSQRSSGASGTVGFRYVGVGTQHQAQSGDGAHGFFGGSGEGVNSQIINHPGARDGSAFGAGGGGANRDRGGSGSAGLIKIWEYGILNAGVIVSGAADFFSPVQGATGELVRELIHEGDGESINGVVLATDPIRIQFEGDNAWLFNGSEGAGPLGDIFQTGSDWEHTIFAVVKPFISHSALVMNYATENLGGSASVGISLSSDGVFEYNVHSASFTGSVNPVIGTQVSASANVILASGTMLFGGFDSGDGEGATVGGKAYAFQDTLTNSDGNVFVGTSDAEHAANFINAINLGPGAGSAYAASMTLNPLVTASAGSGSIVVLTAKAASIPNAINLNSSDTTVASRSGDFLVGGLWGDVWQTIAYTVGPDGLAKQKAYLNGVLVSTISKSFDLNLIPQGDSMMSLGNDTAGSDSHLATALTGSMAYAGWWGKELTAEEIAVVHNWVVTEGGFGGEIS